LIAAPIKPLTLFFIDKVANYHPENGKFRRWFEEEYSYFKADARFRSLSMPDVSAVHDGYFATSAKGEPKDLIVDRSGVTKDTKEAADAFERIMKKKEELIGFDEPLRFIFSHSALVEGWDNPNVFTICNLQEGRSVMRRRQQIGRGLRLPVMANGDRCRNDEINLLTVIAHEEFSAFAKGLQEEIETETGTSFSGRVINVRDKLTLRLRPEKLTDPAFAELWKRISRRTTYRLSFDTEALVDEAVARINGMGDLEPIKFRISKDIVSMNSVEVAGTGSNSREEVAVGRTGPLPDVVGELTRRVALSRATIVAILRRIDNAHQVKINPAAFIDKVEQAMKAALYSQVSSGIVYTPTGQRWEASLFEELHQEETFAHKSHVVDVTKSVTDKVVCDSQVEVDFAKHLEGRNDVPFFLKLPGWFKISTPLGNYNPDWALVRNAPDGERAYLVRETKGTDKKDELRWESEGWKIDFGAAHFSALSVDFFWGNDARVLVEVPPH
jgi:type III restriction enzyme